jgi:endo-1,4-beta-xylanase
MNFKFKNISTIFLVVFVFCSSCSQKPKLKDAFKGYFYIGAAVSQSQISGDDPKAIEIVKEHFNTITSENALKWERIHPALNKYNFAPADSFVDFGEKNNMFIVGHTLIWHSQVPKWVFEGSTGKRVSRDTLLKRMHDHIFAVVGRYKGRVKGWDVVNEAIDENGELRKTKWLEIIGEDYIQKAFEFAREADPNAELYYNDYNIENPVKRNNALIKMLGDLKSKGVRVDGIGIQAHWHLDVPELKDIDSSIVVFSNLGLKVMITELDVNVLPRPENLSGAEVSSKFEMKKELNPYPLDLPDSMQQKLAKRYADIFRIFVKHKGKVSRVTFWGVYDGQSWLNNWPIKGRTNYPLLFDRYYNPKPAFYAVANTTK